MERFSTQSLTRNKIYRPNLYFKEGNTEQLRRMWEDKNEQIITETSQEAELENHKGETHKEETIPSGCLSGEEF